MSDYRFDAMQTFHDLRTFSNSVPVRRQGYMWVTDKQYAIWERFTGGTFRGRHGFLLCNGIELLPEGYRIPNDSPM